MIGGNIKADIQIRSGESFNEIGERLEDWQTVQQITGWLDMQSGDSNYINYNAKLQESTHVFVADYVALNEQISAENSRLVVGGNRYDVMMIDNPMELNKQLEIYLKFTGGQ